MNMKNLWIAALSGAVLTELFSNIPIVGLANCLLCAWFWLGGIFAVWLYRRLSGSLTTRQAAMVGLLTGACAGVLGIVLSFAGLAGAQGMANFAREIAGPEGAGGIDEIPAWAGIVFNIIGTLFNVLFGWVGGIIGGRIFKATPAQR
jgi:hypothetical protein